MFFLRPKPKSDDILPPPPPFPGIEFEETEKQAQAQSEPLVPEPPKELTEIAKEFEDNFIFGKKESRNKPSEKKQKSEKIPRYLKDDGIGSHFDDDIRQLQSITKPNSLKEAREEIKTAIEKIKRHRPTLMEQVVSKLEKLKQQDDTRKEGYYQQPFYGSANPDIQEDASDNILVARNKINESRQFLMRFDLDSAKRTYIEAMSLYKNLSPQEQAKVYMEVSDLYAERKSAERMQQMQIKA